MKLLSVDIAKIKKPQFKGLQLSTDDPPISIPTEHLKKPAIAYTDEDRAYTQLIAAYPLVEALVEGLDLVSTKSGKPLRKVELSGDPHQIKKLTAIAERILEPGDSYSREQIIERLIGATNVTQQRAETGFSLMLDAGAIEKTGGGGYYLGGYTPF